MDSSSIDLLRGTLDLLILKTLSWGPLHGYAISSSIRRQTEDRLLVEEGALYPALHRLEARGFIEAAWGLSENNRRAKFYRLTPPGRQRLQADSGQWTQYAELMARVLGAVRSPEGVES